MSQERRRAREAREAEAARVQAVAPPATPRATERPVGGRRRRETVYRQRRFPPLPWRLKSALGVGWVAVLSLTLYLSRSWGVRLGMLILTTAALPLIVVLVRDPSRRSR